MDSLGVGETESDVMAGVMDPISTRIGNERVAEGIEHRRSTGITR